MYKKIIVSLIVYFIYNISFGQISYIFNMKSNSLYTTNIVKLSNGKEYGEDYFKVEIDTSRKEVTIFSIERSKQLTRKLKYMLKVYRAGYYGKIPEYVSDKFVMSYDGHTFYFDEKINGQFISTSYWQLGYVHKPKGIQ